MENNESNLKPQPTGGLKLMTVFIAVLALHVLVIGGFTVWHLLNPPSTDTDLADKNHKGAKIVSDATLSGDVTSTDGTVTTAPANGTGTPSATTPATDTTAEATTDATATPASTADATTTPTTPAPAVTTVTASTSDALEPKPGNTPLMVSPPPDDASSIAAGPTSDMPSGPLRHGPVINPPDNLAPPADASSTALNTSTTPTTPSATTPIDGATPVADGTPYTVRKGDSLARIAHRHHVALAQLKMANSLTSDRLSIGQKLVIPNRAEKLATTDASEAASAPTMSATDTTDSTPAPAVSTASTGVEPKHLHLHKTTAASGHRLYTVVKGDTLMKIARRFRTTAGAIMAANNITNASRLSIGKKLHIPSGESRTAASARETAPTERASKTAAHGQLANYVP
jgi:LysM repeat protein